ncbi:MAG: GNAT family N-acetyltransferase [Desulfurococcaceae archaeon]
MSFNISECSDLNPIIELFYTHKNEPFTYIGDTHLFKLFSRLDFCRIFEAKANQTTVGSIYAMKYMYGYGWLGGLLVNKEFRRRGVGKKLLDRAVDWLEAPYTYAFVEPENAAARRLFEDAGFNAIYRRLNYKVQLQTLSHKQSKNEVANLDLEWSELTKAVGYRERRGIVNLGYYPIKLTEDVFNDLKNKRKVLRLGDIVAIVERSYVVTLGEYNFIFNDYILGKVSIPTKNKVVEVNPFYIKQSAHDLIKLLKGLADGELVIWTYEGDPVTRRLTLKGELGALVLEHENVKNSS